VFEIGKAGYLPDISSSFAFWRTYAVNSIKQHDFDGACGGLYNLNGCLTEDYVITISTKEYEKSIHEQSFYQCNYCTMLIDKIINKGEEDERTEKVEVPSEIPCNEVKILEILNPNMEFFITGNKYEKVWVCPSCKKDNIKGKDWNVIKPKKEMPFYQKVVPQCPVRLKGISGRVKWINNFTGWFYNFLEEIQVSMKFYRIEYISQTGHDMEDSGYKDKGDESNASS